MAESNGITFGGKKKKKTDIKIQKSQGDQGGANGTAGANPGGTSFSTGGGFGTDSNGVDTGGFGGSQGSPSNTHTPPQVSFAESKLGQAIAKKKGLAKNTIASLANRGQDPNGSGSPTYISETNAINDTNGQNTPLGFVPNSPAKEATYTDPIRAETNAINTPVDPGFYNNKNTGVNFEGSNTFDSEERSGRLGATSINTPDTEFSVNKLANPRSDGTTHNLELTNPDGSINQGTVSANVANRLGRGSSSFTQLDPGVTASQAGQSLFGRPAESGNTGSTGSGLSFDDRARRSIGGPIAPRSAAQEFARFNQGSLNSSNPFKRAAANRQMKQALAIDTQNAGIYKTNIVADTARSNNIDNNNQNDSEFSRKLESDNANNLRAFQNGQVAKPLSSSEQLAKNRFQYTKNKDTNSNINKAVNLKNASGFGEAEPARKLQGLLQIMPKNKEGQSKAPPRSAIEQIYPEVANIFSSSKNRDEFHSALLDQLKLSPREAHVLQNTYY